MLHASGDALRVVHPPDRRPATDAVAPATFREVDPALLILTCASCGTAMDERPCKPACRSGDLLPCSHHC